jgi:8-oxo-dGTP pyrophosphatase MutT (NUDIX family)
MKPGQIRPLVICIFRWDRVILVAESFDSSKGEVFYRPIGGEINFGESSQAALVREVREELEAEITHLCYLGTLENLFTYENQAGHEIVQIYDAEFVDRSLYEQVWLEGREDNGLSFKAIWKPLADFENEAERLYPTGLFELLQKYDLPG